MGSPHGQAAKAMACLRACCQGQGHGSPNALAAKAKARSQGHGMLAWARCHARSKAPGGMQQGPWGHAARPLGARSLRGSPPMARPWHALGTSRRPWQHLGGLLLPSLDSLFGPLLLFPP